MPCRGWSEGGGGEISRTRPWLWLRSASDRAIAAGRPARSCARQRPPRPQSQCRPHVRPAAGRRYAVAAEHLEAPGGGGRWGRLWRRRSWGGGGEAGKAGTCTMRVISSSYTLSHTPSVASTCRPGRRPSQRCRGSTRDGTGTGDTPTRHHGDRPPATKAGTGNEGVRGYPPPPESSAGARGRQRDREGGREEGGREGGREKDATSGGHRATPRAYRYR